MNKKELINYLWNVKKDDKETIDKLISLNERLLFEVRDIVSEFKKYLITQNKENK